MNLELTKENLFFVALGGVGMFLIDSFTGVIPDYWNVISGAWAYGLLGGWLVYGDDVLEYFSKTND